MNGTLRNATLNYCLLFDNMTMEIVMVIALNMNPLCSKVTWERLFSFVQRK